MPIIVRTGAWSIVKGAAGSVTAGAAGKSRWALAGDRNVDVGVIATAAVAENSFLGKECTRSRWLQPVF
ncbi:hypothetical protein [Rhizobium sp. AN80A]|uniref:hypothetical protein n=1 Tax=Rhizobium sp. AN80A TaxID=3040673 RepID=UPI0024B39F3A|nr:hypothetical protein [Rhizobium sp. AN80A]